MNKMVFLAVLGSLTFASCSKDLDSNEPENANVVTSDDIKANVEKVFGVTFDPNHDWCSTTSGVVTIHSNSAVQKVRLYVCVEEINEDGETVTSMRVLNEKETQGQSTVTLNYDAPKDNLGLFVAFISDSQYTVKKVTDNTVSIDSHAMTRSLPTDLIFPTGTFTLATVEESYASARGWNPGEKLYQLSDYTAQKMTVGEYSQEFSDLFRTMVFSLLKNGRKYNNLNIVKTNMDYNEKVYLETTGEEPIVISPVYKNDGGWKEVVNSDLYYYYFKESDLGDDPVAYLKSLPKYKAIQFDQCIKDDDVISRHASYALLYWGDGVPVTEQDANEKKTVGKYDFPAGYKIGFMVRAKTTAENLAKQGELYADGRLNNDINNYGNFKSSKMGTDGPRAAWLTLNDKMLLCWESGTDTDFNDIVMEVEGGVEGFISFPFPEYNEYTYCFEDTELGDYDMNDVVIKAVRKSDTQIQYSIVACGGWDELFVRNINVGAIKDDAEVHALFGKKPLQFVNTESDVAPASVITVTKTVPSTFSFLDSTTDPYIFNKTTGKTIYLSRKGEDPHGIMIPNDFKYPLEKVCIKDAYLEFNNWGKNSVSSTKWYTNPVIDKVRN